MGTECVLIYVFVRLPSSLYLAMWRTGQPSVIETSSLELRHMKSKFVVKLATAFAVLALASTAFAQQPAPAFDGKKFFEELSSRGFKSPAGFDGKKFFEELQSRGFNNTNKFDGKKFFEELSSRGFSTPAGFDGKKFWEEQSKTGGYNMPPMVDAAK